MLHEKSIDKTILNWLLCTWGDRGWWQTLMTAIHHRMSETRYSIAVVGCGIGGAALALALQEKELLVKVYEGDTSFDVRKQGYVSWALSSASDFFLRRSNLQLWFHNATSWTCCPRVGCRTSCGCSLAITLHLFPRRTHRWFFWPSISRNWWWTP